MFLVWIIRTPRRGSKLGRTSEVKAALVRMWRRVVVVAIVDADAYSSAHVPSQQYRRQPDQPSEACLPICPPSLGSTADASVKSRSLQ
jgi:hypothetical protein